MFADETGLNTLSKEDRNEGGTKYVCAKGQIPKTKCTTLDNRCTVLPFTSATGKAVMCCVIYQHKGNAVPADLVTGVDP